jgi:hypothetical protein
LQGGGVPAQHNAVAGLDGRRRTARPPEPWNQQQRAAGTGVLQELPPRNPGAIS